MDPELLRRWRELLTLLTEGPCALEPLPCRTAVYPGGEVPWDTCETTRAGRNGQLWINAQPATVVNQGGGCRSITWTAEVGIVRCVAGPGEDGSPPPVRLVEHDADRQASDAKTIRDAILCCPERPDWLHEVEVLSWAPLGPTGGCAGGVYTVRGILDVCC